MHNKCAHPLSNTYLKLFFSLSLNVFWVRVGLEHLDLIVCRSGPPKPSFGLWPHSQLQKSVDTQPGKITVQIPLLKKANETSLGPS